MTQDRTINASRLLVTGATGFIGSSLALHAHRQGVDIVATGRAENKAESLRADELRAAGVRVSIGTLEDRDFLRGVVAGRETIIHLAAAQHESQKPDRYFRSVNVEGTRALLQVARATGIRRFVYGSSIGVYGSSTEQPLDEQSETRPQNIYTQTKLEAEGVLKEFADDFETCVIRISETYGPSDFRLLKLFRAIERGHFVILGSGMNLRQCMHVNDLIRALMLAAQHPAAAGQTFVVAGNQVLTTNQMVEIIAAAVERSPPHRHLPLWPFKMVASALESVLPPIGIQPPLHRRRLDFFSKSFVFSTVKARSMLGFMPEIDFFNGAVDTAQWYRMRGYLPPRMTSELPGSGPSEDALVK